MNAGATAPIRKIDFFDEVDLVSDGPVVDWLRKESASKEQEKTLFLLDTDHFVYVPETLKASDHLIRVGDILHQLGATQGLAGKVRWVSSPVFKTLLNSILSGQDYRDLGYRSTIAASQHEVSMLDGDSVLREAIERNASDIHIEARRERGFLSRIRLRIDGLLQDVSVVAEEEAARLIRSYFTGQSFGAGQWSVDAPGDGMFEYEYKDDTGNSKVFTIRLNSIPLVCNGLKLVARLRSPTDVQALSDAGYHKSQLEVIREVSGYSEGIFLFVGPTNSGKSTSLNAVMNAIPEERCVVELADPIEAYLQNCVHVSVPSTTEKDKAVAKKLMEATVRQDTDVLVLGEIRNADTVNQASNLSEQGKVVLSTLHTSSVVGIHARLVGLGMKPDLLTLPNFIRGGVAQKLIPVNCPDCSIPMRQMKKIPSGRRSLIDRLTAIHPIAENMRFRNPDGCGKCLGGFRGRTLVAEVMTVDAKIRQFYAKGDFSYMDRYLIDERGMLSLRAHAFGKIGAGLLDPEAVEVRVEKIQRSDFRWAPPVAPMEAKAA